MSSSANGKKKNGFHLSKWYLDFVGADGTVVIGYAAKLGWHSYSVPYSNLLVNKPGTAPYQLSSFRKVTMPVISEEEITWDPENLKVSGKWIKKSNSIEEKLVSTEEGFLNWQCYQPRAEVELEIEGSTIKGAGYVEELVMTIPAWKIPMNELRWGHVVSDDYCIVWIEIKEKDSKQWVWVNDDPVEASTINEDEILIPALKLKIALEQKRILESEQKIKSVVRNLKRFLPGFDKILPAKFLMADSIKWYSEARLIRNDELVSSGQCVHELVKFN